MSFAFWEEEMKRTTVGAFALVAGLAMPQAALAETEITVWSWNIGASSLAIDMPSFKEAHPDVTVVVEDLGVQQVFDRMLAACAAGGAGLPDVVSVQNRRAEVFWSQFPDCFADLEPLGFDDAMKAQFAPFKLPELQANERTYAMPWDSGPVVMFYRRDYYENAGVDPASIVTWDDFIYAGLKVQEANDGVTMTQSSINGDPEFFEMIANENGCSYFSDDATAITLDAPACAEALDVVRKMDAADLITDGGWTEKIQSTVAGTVATHMYGGWYEGTIRTNAEDQSGLWGVFAMPSISEGGARAANFGGSALAIAANSENTEIAFEFLKHKLARPDSQVNMLMQYGLVPSLTTALDTDFVQQPQEFWGGQAVWADILKTLPVIKPSRGTPFYGDATAIMSAVQIKYLNGGYDSATDAVADAAQQLSLATGLPVE